MMKDSIGTATPGERWPAELNLQAADSLQTVKYIRADLVQSADGTPLSVQYACEDGAWPIKRLEELRQQYIASGNNRAETVAYIKGLHQELHTLLSAGVNSEPVAWMDPSDHFNLIDAKTLAKWKANGWHQEASAKLTVPLFTHSAITNAAPQVPEVREVPENIPIVSSPAVAAPIPSGDGWNYSNGGKPHYTRSCKTCGRLQAHGPGGWTDVP